MDLFVGKTYGWGWTRTDPERARSWWQIYGSRGRPSSRSAMMLSCTSDVPP